MNRAAGVSGGVSRRSDADRADREQPSVALSDLGYAPAFIALSSGDSSLDPYLPPLRRLESAVKDRRAELEVEGREGLWTAVKAIATRVGAPPPAHRAIDLLHRGAPAVFTGQQPGLLGGPAFTLYKAATAVVLARRLTEALGDPVVPIFWVASDDADFDEIATATVAHTNLALHTVTLDRTLRHPERMVGHLPVEAGRQALEELKMAGMGGGRALELGGRVWERGNDWGEGFASLLYALLGNEGLIVIDARQSELRQIARPILERVLDDVGGFSKAVDSSGEALARAGLGRQLGEFAATFPIWHEEPPWRRRFTADGTHQEKGGDTAALVREARRVLAGDRGGALWPSVALRPLVVDFALPIVARVLGPAEVAYMAQLAPAYSFLGVKMPPAVPRLSATLMPETAFSLAADAGSDAGALICRWGPTLEGYYRRRLPSGVAAALTRLEAAERDGFAAARAALGAFGPGLDQLVDSIAGKAEFQRGRLWEAAIKREKSRAEEELPELRHLPAFLRPDQGLQERRIAVLGALALAGEGLVEKVLRQAESHLDRLAAGRPGHALIELKA